jgi:hypothetical protein
MAEAEGKRDENNCGMMGSYGKFLAGGCELI